MRVLLFGGSGILGRALKPALEKAGARVVAPPHAECDLADTAALDKVLASDLDFIINAAALIHVDKIEEDPKEAFAVNATAAGHIAMRLAERGSSVPYLYISTHYVFGDEKEAYREDDAPAPVNKYGESKAEGERLVRENSRGNFYIVRTAWLYGSGNTFVDHVVKALIAGGSYPASGQRGNITYTPVLAQRIVDTFLSGEKENGIYHLTDACDLDIGVSRLEIASEIARILGKPQELVQKASDVQVFRARRPAHAALLSTKLPPLPHWKESLARYLRSRWTA